MKTYFKAIIFLLSSFSLLIASCEKDIGPYIINQTESPLDTIHYVKFSTEIQSIFDERCIVCHNYGHPYLNLLTDSSYNQLLHTGRLAPYVNIVIPEHSNIYLHITGQDILMPPIPPTLTDVQKSTILKWIQQGAMNN